VKCDRNLPCDGCVKRDHADLCSYERPSKKRQISTSHSILDNAGSRPAGGDHQQLSVAAPDGVNISPNLGGTTALGGKVSLPREDWENVCNKLKEMEQTISSLRMGLEQLEEGRIATAESSGIHRSADTSDSPEREGIHTANMLGEGTVHLGSRSVLAYILNKSGSLQAQALLEGGILPKLGLDNETATYPFVDLWSSDTSTFDVSAVCEALPSDQQCREFFYFYRDIAGTLYPVLVDVSLFEENFEMLLRNRAAAGGTLKADDDQALLRPFGMGLAYIGLLFAVLASGCQSSDLPGKQRELTSQVYVCCSYQCLRMTNFVSQPTIEAMKTLLIIGNVLSYNMNPGVSYVILGMTLRMGLVLGLHVESNRFSLAERYTREHVWWSMAWQDSHFSLSYDRPSTTAICQPEIAFRQDSGPGEYDYFETMSRIISLTLEIVRGRMLSPQYPMSFKAIQTYKEGIQKILVDAAPHLRDRKYCLSSMDHLQRLALKVHASYITSELCRPALKAVAGDADPLTTKVRKDCVSSLIGTVESYIELHSFSTHGSRSWITLQRAISSAFLLAVIEESKSEPQVWRLLRQLESVIADRANAETEFDGSDTRTNKIAAASPPQGTTVQAVSSASFNTIPGVTNAPLSISDPFSGPATTAVPASVAADTRTQWAKPLTKSLRALQKLNAAFSKGSFPWSGSGDSPNYQGHGGSSTHVSAPGIGCYPHSGSSNAPTNVGSLPPPTPESSTSSEWTIPNLLDRAAEYIHPPLWG
jgi:hypothetical protein